jgi:hypothetical protein
MTTSSGLDRVTNHDTDPVGVDADGIGENAQPRIRRMRFKLKAVDEDFLRSAHSVKSQCLRFRSRPTVSGPR